MAVTIIIAVAGLMGACGIILAAAGAHAAPGQGLDGAAYILLFHAAAILGGVAMLRQDLVSRPVMFGVLGAWVLGAALFAGDLALRAWTGNRLFPMAAPSGGVVLVLAWLGLVAAALVRN